MQTLLSHIFTPYTLLIFYFILLLIILPIGLFLAVLRFISEIAEEIRYDIGGVCKSIKHFYAKETQYGRKVRS